MEQLQHRQLIEQALMYALRYQLEPKLLFFLMLVQALERKERVILQHQHQQLIEQAHLYVYFITIKYFNFLTLRYKLARKQLLL